MGWSKPKAVKCIETGEIFPSIQAAARAKSTSASNLCRMVKYKLPGMCGGYHWEATSLEEEKSVSGV